MDLLIFPALWVIHNSLHCKEAGCDWDDCFEFTGSDHFLLDVTFEDVSVRLDEPSAIKMPHHWHESSLWEHGFNRCSSVLLGLDELVRTFQEMVQPSVFRKACLPDWVVWAVEVLTLLLCVVESCVRDGWVLFADLEGRKRKRQSQQNLVFSDEDDFEAMLLRNQRDHGWPQSCVKTCLKWLKPLTHDPPGRLQCDGTLLSRADSHQAWVHHLTLQGSWPISFNQYLSMIVLKVQLPNRSKVRGLTLAKVFLMAGLMTLSGTGLQKESTLQELVHPFCSTGFC